MSEVLSRPSVPYRRTIRDQSRPGGRALLLDIERREDYAPGQVIGLSMRPEDPPRWYSIASSPDMPDYQIIYTPVDGGLLTPQLADLEPGAEVWLWPPKGSFRDPGQPSPVHHAPPGSARTAPTDLPNLAGTSPTAPSLPPGRVWWICNGTGLAPFVSFFRAGIRKNRTLVHGAMNRDEAWFRDIFLEEAAKAGRLEPTGNPEPGKPPHPAASSHSPDDPPLPASDAFCYIPCLSRDGTDGIPGAWPGRLSAWLAAQGRQLFGPDDHFLLCGSPGMIVQVREHLLSAGFGHERISSEIYF